MAATYQQYLSQQGQGAVPIDEIGVYDLASLANQANGTYAEARALLSQADAWANEARDRGDGWFTDAPDQTTRENLVRRVAELRSVIATQPGDFQCPNWLEVRSAYFSARALVAGADEVNVQESRNLEALGTDLKNNAVDAAKVGLGIGAIVLVAVIIVIALK